MGTLRCFSLNGPIPQTFFPCFEDVDGFAVALGGRHNLWEGLGSHCYVTRPSVPPSCSLENSFLFLCLQVLLGTRSLFLTFSPNRNTSLQFLCLCPYSSLCCVKFSQGSSIVFFKLQSLLIKFVNSFGRQTLQLWIRLIIRSNPLSCLPL